MHENIQTMKKAVSVTMKKVTTIFVRRKSKSPRDGNSLPHTPEDESCPQIENGLEVNEDGHAFPRDDNTESSPEPLEMLQSSEDESLDYFSYPRQGEQRRRTRGHSPNKTSGPVVKNKGNQQGACGPPINEYRNDALVPMNCEREIAHCYRQPEKVCQGVVLKSCGELEMKCTNLPLELQVKVSDIKTKLLLKYPPHYDFCIIASEEDYDEAERFKEYVASTFGLAGCTFDDGFSSLGTELFDRYEMMMDQSTKVFFFVTENFTSNAFCKRIQSGAVFQCLMSKAQKDKEKCVPVFPHGLCRTPLALSGIAGLNSTQRDVTRRSLDNTYSPLLRQHRLALDRVNFKRRCLEFQEEVMRCIADYEVKSIQNDPSGMNLREIDSGRRHPLSLEAPSSCQPVIQLADDSNEPEERFLSSPHSPSTPLIVLPEDYDPRGHIVGKPDVSESSDDTGLSTTIKRKLEQFRKEDHSHSHQQKSPIEEREKYEGVQHDSVENDGNCIDNDDVLKDLPIPQEIREILKENIASSVSIKDCATVHVGNSIQIIINQASSTDFSRLDHLINQETASSSEKMPSEHLTDSD